MATFIWSLVRIYSFPRKTWHSEMLLTYDAHFFTGFVFSGKLKSLLVSWTTVDSCWSACCLGKILRYTPSVACEWPIKKLMLWSYCQLQGDLPVLVQLHYIPPLCYHHSGFDSPSYSHLYLSFFRYLNKKGKKKTKKE